MRILVAICCIALVPALATAQPTDDVNIPVRGATLAATISYPAGPGPHPAVVMLSGSGPSTRDTLRKFAEPMRQLGFATLVFDKRGVGESTGSWTSASFDDNVADAAAAMDALKRAPRIDGSRVGVWGVSQAGWFIPALAARRADLAFAIVLTGGGTPPRDVEMFMHEQALDSANIAAPDRAKAIALLNAYFDWLGTGRDRQRVVDLITAAKGSRWYAPVAIDGVMPSEAGRSNWEWVALYDPARDIARMKVPTLVILGGDDRMGSPSGAAQRWKAGLQAAGNTEARVEIVQGMGHAATIGANHDQGSAVMPAYLELVSRFLSRFTSTR